MTCQNKCKSERNLVERLEKAIAQGGCPCVPESFEKQATGYCANCVHDEKVGTGYRRTYQK